MKNEKISKSIKAKLMTKKLIKLRQLSILNRYIQEKFPYITIKKIEIDFCNLPEELNKEYKETLENEKNKS